MADQTLTPRLTCHRRRSALGSGSNGSERKGRELAGGDQRPLQCITGARIAWVLWGAARDGRRPGARGGYGELT
ncbi:hypothetical protein U9M48_008770 [Paspalum notatum var. saurae]|uniref:Uncharacterized protein n=1 Tax=Paspalum notatum var. saurae TaxID=547442 RepID=A0AAQ3SPQ3_PASNO